MPHAIRIPKPIERFTVKPRKNVRDVVYPIFTPPP